MLEWARKKNVLLYSSDFIDSEIALVLVKADAVIVPLWGGHVVLLERTTYRGSVRIKWKPNCLLCDRLRYTEPLQVQLERVFTPGHCWPRDAREPDGHFGVWNTIWMKILFSLAEVIMETLLRERGVNVIILSLLWVGRRLFYRKSWRRTHFCVPINVKYFSSIITTTNTTHVCSSNLISTWLSSISCENMLK